MNKRLSDDFVRAFKGVADPSASKDYAGAKREA